jgi:hypothetical protein
VQLFRIDGAGGLGQGLLRELPGLFDAASCTPCRCDLQGRVTKKESIPNFYSFGLGNPQ